MTIKNFFAKRAELITAINAETSATRFEILGDRLKSKVNTTFTVPKDFFKLVVTEPKMSTKGTRYNEFYLEISDDLKIPLRMFGFQEPIFADRRSTESVYVPLNDLTDLAEIAEKMSDYEGKKFNITCFRSHYRDCRFREGRWQHDFIVLTKAD